MKIVDEDHYGHFRAVLFQAVRTGKAAATTIAQSMLRIFIPISIFSCSGPLIPAETTIASP